MTSARPDQPKSVMLSRCTEIAKYLVCYQLGVISCCIIFTPVSLGIWLFCTFLAPVGFFLYFLYLTPQYVFGPKATYWLVGSIALIPIVFEVVNYFKRIKILSTLRPLFVGFPLGFIGTLGVYFTALASV